MELISQNPVLPLGCPVGRFVCWRGRGLPTGVEASPYPLPRKWAVTGQRQDLAVDYQPRVIIASH
jgi:hypothetical protein